VAPPTGNLGHGTRERGKDDRDLQDIFIGRGKLVGAVASPSPHVPILCEKEGEVGATSDLDHGEARGRAQEFLWSAFGVRSFGTA
jgi:hypothetical protein